MDVFANPAWQVTFELKSSQAERGNPGPAPSLRAERGNPVVEGALRLDRQQIQSGGPITLTHADVTRYFMTIPEAAQLVIQAGAMASGGDVYVLDMGQPVKISDLAQRMVVLSGLTVKDEEHPSGDIEIQVKGLRPGEKLYEELLIGDNPLPTNHPRIMKAHEEFLLWEDLHDKLQALCLALDLNDVPHIRKQLKDLVPGYQPEGDVVDWVWMENEKLAMV